MGKLIKNNFRQLFNLARAYGNRYFVFNGRLYNTLNAGEDKSYWEKNYQDNMAHLSNKDHNAENNYGWGGENKLRPENYSETTIDGEDRVSETKGNTVIYTWPGTLPNPDRFNVRETTNLGNNVYHIKNYDTYPSNNNRSYLITNNEQVDIIPNNNSQRTIYKASPEIQVVNTTRKAHTSTKTVGKNKNTVTSSGVPVNIAKPTTSTSFSIHTPWNSK